jgi:hypothetical protein
MVLLANQGKISKFSLFSNVDLDGYLVAIQ